MAAALVAATMSGSWTTRAFAQSAAQALYEQTQAAEQTARADSQPALDGLRKVARTYETLVLKYPTSGYADNALWQAAGLYASAFQQSADANDRQQAERLLKWLKQEYPSSPFIKKIDGVTQTLTAAPNPLPPTAPAAATENTPPASPAVPTSMPAGASATAVVKSITETALPHGERITIEFSREVTYTGDRLENPDRVFFDFANSTAPASLIEHAPAPAGSLVKALRVGRHSSTVTRVVLELAGNPRYSAFPMYSPFRLVVDVESADAAPSSAGIGLVSSVTPSAPPTTKTAPAATPHTDVDSAKDSSKDTVRESPKDASREPARDAAKTSAKPAPPASTPTPTPTPTPPPTSNVEPPPAMKIGATAAAAAAGSPAPPSSNKSGEYSLSRQLGLGVSRIVVDAGHGGHDPGAQAFGIDESELTLDVAERLQKLLEAQPGFEVVLTRDSDNYIALDERTAIANREGADLFLSIHANASKQPAVSGIETYFLNFATNPSAEAVAARENASSGQTMGTLPDILKAIALNNKLAESRELASIVQTSLVRRLSAQNKTIRDLGVKQAPFVVLIGAQMPSVLAEISFLTNRSEATLLKQSTYRQKIAQALFDGIVKYQASLKKVTTVASKDPGR
jgi:N-acetylmuramoyl-L-alanine amidase